MEIFHPVLGEVDVQTVRKCPEGRNSATEVLIGHTTGCEAAILEWTANVSKTRYTARARFCKLLRNLHSL